MENLKYPYVINYMLRHLILFNVTDPLADTSRGYSSYTQYFSGTGAAGQINYLARKPISGEKFIVQVSGVTKVDGTDYDLSVSSGTITWKAGKAPADGNDNISVEYTAVKPWIYDDHPALSSSYFPRITIESQTATYEPPGMGTYLTYNSGSGDRVIFQNVISVRNRQNNIDYTYGSIKYRNMDLVDQISENIVNYFQTNKHPCPWNFYYWNIDSVVRDRSEEDFGIFKKDIMLTLEYFDKS